MKSEYLYMTVIAPSLILLPLVTASCKYRALPIEARILFLYFMLDAAVSIISSLLAWKHLPNMPLYHVAAIAEPAVIVYFFIAVFKDARLTRILKRLMAVFALLGILNSIFIQHIFEFNSYALSLQSAIVITLCFMYWWRMEDGREKPWAALPLNWLISGLLLYYSASFVLLTCSNAIISMPSKSLSVVLWNIHVTLAVFMYIFISIGFSKYKL